MIRSKLVFCCIGWILIVATFFPGSVNASITDWLTTSSLPYQIASHVSFVSNSLIYTVGGSKSTGESHDETLKSFIETDGNLTSWTFDSLLPKKLIWHSVASDSDRVYVLGGYLDWIPDEPVGAVNSVYFANLADDPLSWSTTSALPKARGVGAAVIRNNIIYYAGGFETPGAPVPEVYMANINPDGSLQSWSLAGSLPEPNYGHALVNVNNYVYLLGGKNDWGTDLAKAYRAQFNPDGSILAWEEQAQMPSIAYRGGVAVANGAIYVVIGNYTYWTVPDAVTGDITTWQASPYLLPVLWCCGSAVATNDYLYLIGGYGDGYMDRVYFTQLDAGPTPSPTPILSGSSPVVVIPGLGASWNYEA